jgi:hypothetical protein
VTVPVTVPGPVTQPLDPELPDEPELSEQHELDEPEDPLLPLEALLHEVVPSSRLASAPRPMPEATWGRTVTRSTKPATAIMTSRICLRQRFMTTPPLRRAQVRPSRVRR